MLAPTRIGSRDAARGRLCRNTRCDDMNHSAGLAVEAEHEPHVVGRAERAQARHVLAEPPVADVLVEPPAPLDLADVQIRAGRLRDTVTRSPR